MAVVDVLVVVAVWALVVVGGGRGDFTLVSGCSSTSLSCCGSDA